MTDKTPRTDAWLAAHHSHKKLIDFARTLERELADCREELERLKESRQQNIESQK